MHLAPPEPTRRQSCAMWPGRGRHSENRLALWPGKSGLGGALEHEWPSMKARTSASSGRAAIEVGMQSRGPAARDSSIWVAPVGGGQAGTAGHGGGERRPHEQRRLCAGVLLGQGPQALQEAAIPAGSGTAARHTRTEGVRRAHRPCARCAWPSSRAAAGGGGVTHSCTSPCPTRELLAGVRGRAACRGGVASRHGHAIG